MNKIKIGYVYCIRSHQTDQIYIGSTKQRLCNRIAKHRNHYKRYLNGKCNYITSFELLKHDDAYIEIISEHENLTKNELHKFEGETIRTTLNCVNRCIAGRNVKQYYNDNKDKIITYKKQYRCDNKDKISERDKQYSLIHKDQKKEYDHQYRSKNKDKINELRSQKIMCPLCQCSFSRINKMRHERSQKHISNSSSETE